MIADSVGLVRSTQTNGISFHSAGHETLYHQTSSRRVGDLRRTTYLDMQDIIVHNVHNHCAFMNAAECPRVTGIVLGSRSWRLPTVGIGPGPGHELSDDHHRPLSVRPWNQGIPSRCWNMYRGHSTTSSRLLNAIVHLYSSTYSSCSQGPSRCHVQQMSPKHSFSYYHQGPI
jgi:hypothetical protein